MEQASDGEDEQPVNNATVVQNQPYDEVSWRGSPQVAAQGMMNTQPFPVFACDWSAVALNCAGGASERHR